MPYETALKANLNALKKKLENIEERFVIGEIDRELYDKYSSKYKNEYFEIEQEVEKTSGYSSNLKKVINFVAKTSTNVLPLLWRIKKFFNKCYSPTESSIITN
jgi:hypothetical protein